MKKEAKQTQQPHHKEELTDLSSALTADPNFLCEHCLSVVMLPYPQGRLQNPHAGECYICPTCGLIVDSSLTKMAYEDAVKPIDVNPFSFEIVSEDKAHRPKVEEYDPEPLDDANIKAQGGVILDKRITVRRDY